jgi:nucleotide-binding universal stress UspA family protein
MEKKILVAADDSIYSRHAVEYAVKMSSVVKDLTYTLFHVQPPVSQYLLDEAKTSFKARGEVQNVIRKNAEESRAILEKCKAKMVGMGVDDRHIDVVTEPRMLGVAKDVLEYAELGLYDAIVVGRRGLSHVQKTLMGSIAADLVEQSMAAPVWVTDGSVMSTKIMLAIDGSESSLRAVDHLSFMVSQNPEVKVTLFHVIPRLGHYNAIDFDDKAADMNGLQAEADRDIEHFYGCAQEKFREAGIQESQIEIKVRRCTVNVSKAIVDEANKGHYGTLVVGRRGAGKAFFMGSVSRHVLDRVSNQALWLVP